MIEFGIIEDQSSESGSGSGSKVTIAQLVRCWTRLSLMTPCFDPFSAISTNRRGTNSSVFHFPSAKNIFRSMVRNIQAQMMNMKNILISFWRRAIVKVNSYIWGIVQCTFIKGLWCVFRHDVIWQIVHITWKWLTLMINNKFR